MYSRKFNTSGVLPPDYSGVALRSEAKEVLRRPAPDEECCRPKHPVFEKDPPLCEDFDKGKCPPKNVPPPAECKEPTPVRSSKGGGFSLEDIILAGLLLLVLNDENADSGLLVILGLLLLAGV